MKKIAYTLYRVLCILTASFCKMPDFIIIGTQKGGTTSLYNYLKMHPEVKLHRNKEVHFFDKYYSRGVTWYRSWFPFKIYGKKITGEATPCYMFYPGAIKKMKAVLPKAKIIVLLRNPVERAYSHYQMEKRKGREKLSFEEAIEQEKSRLEQERIKLEQRDSYFSKILANHSYLSRGLYAEQLKRLFMYYDKSQVLIIDSKKFKTNTKVTLGEIYSFLELNQFQNRELQRNKNVHTYPPMDEKTKKYLKDFFREPNEELFGLLNRKLDW